MLDYALRYHYTSEAMASKYPTSISLSDKAKGCLEIIEAETGLSRSRIIEVSVRLFARSQKVRIPKDAWYPESADTKGDPT